MSDTKYFEKDTTNFTRKDAIDFLTKHYRYNTMNTWNRTTSYANNVKLHNLNLTREQLDKAYDMLLDSDIDMTEYRCDQQDLLDQFYKETGYTVGFNGRSNGYLVIYETECNQDSNDTNTINVYPGRSIDQNEDFEDWDTADIMDRVKLVQRFDKLCDELRNLLINYIENATIETEIITIQKEHRRLLLQDD